MTDLIQLYVLLCGYEILQKSASTRGEGERFVLAVPISAYLLGTRSGFVLIDAGFDASLLTDAAERERVQSVRGVYAPLPPPVVLPEHGLLQQLRRVGVRPEEVREVVLSHLHLDHTGNLKHFRHARISVQRAELEYARSDAAPDSFVRSDYAGDFNWHLLEGDTELSPGLTALATPGHTPGHQSFRLTLPRTGGVILTADAGDLSENFARERLPGDLTDEAAALASIRRLKEEAERTGATLFLGHDPAFIQTVRLCPEFYD